MWSRRELVTLFSVICSSCAVIGREKTQNATQIVFNAPAVFGEDIDALLFELLSPKVEQIIQSLFENPTLRDFYNKCKKCSEDCWDLPSDGGVKARCILESINKCDLLSKVDISEDLLNMKFLFDHKKLDQILEELSNENSELNTNQFHNNRRKRHTDERELGSEKTLSEFNTNKKSKLLSFIDSISLAATEFENAVYNTTNVLKEMVDTSINISKSAEVDQLKKSTEDAKYIIKTIEHSGKKVSQSVIPLPIQSSLAAGDFAIDSILDSTMRLLTSDEAAQLKTAVDDGKEVISDFIDSGKKAVHFVKAIPKQISVSRVLLCNSADDSNIIDKPLMPEEIKPLKVSLENGIDAVESMADSTKRLAGYLLPLPLQTVKNLSSFALDDMLEKVINVSKTGEASVLNLALIAGVDTAANVVGSGVKLVESVKDIPLQAASSIKSVALEAIGNMQVTKMEENDKF